MQNLSLIGSKTKLIACAMFEVGYKTFLCIDVNFLSVTGSRFEECVALWQCSKAFADDEALFKLKFRKLGFN